MPTEIKPDLATLARYFEQLAYCAGRGTFASPERACAFDDAARVAYAFAAGIVPASVRMALEAQGNTNA